MKSRKSMLIRGYAVSVSVLVIAIGVIYSMFKIHLKEGEELDVFTERSFRTVNESSERGNLYASDGSLLATTITVHDVYVDLTTIKDDLFESEIGALCDSLSQMFQKPTSYFENKLRAERKKGNMYMTLIKGIDYGEYQRLKSFPIFEKGQHRGGFIHETRLRRELVLKDVGARTIGYDNEKGKTGLEGAYSKDLAGVEGIRLEQFMGQGQWRPTSVWEQEPVNGSNVYTTIEAGLQIAAYSALQETLINYDAEYGCVAVMEVETGKIRSIVNLKKIRPGEYADVYNYVIADKAEPGSTFKTVSLLAGLERGKFTPQTTVETGNGSYRLYKRTIHDTHANGTLTVEQVLIKSSNIGTAKLINEGFKGNPQEYFDQLDKWYLTKKMGIDIEGEAMPKFHRPEDSNWSNVTLPVMSYGYGEEVTPLQLLTFYNGIANKGKLLKPLFIDKLEDEKGNIKEFKPVVLNPQMASEENIDAIHTMLEKVVSVGTARNIFTENYEIAGKTGTARVEYWKEGRTRYRASFAGYFPAEDPKYTCVVVVHKPDNNKGIYGGTITAPVFKKIADWIYARTPKKIPQSIATVNVDKKIMDQSELKSDYVSEKMPNVIGKSGEYIVPVLENMGLDVQYEGLGKIKNQSIASGTPFKPGETVYLTLEE